MGQQEKHLEPIIGALCRYVLSLEVGIKYLY